MSPRYLTGLRVVGAAGRVFAFVCLSYGIGSGLDWLENPNSPPWPEHDKLYAAIALLVVSLMPYPAAFYRGALRLLIPLLVALVLGALVRCVVLEPSSNPLAEPALIVVFAALLFVPPYHYAVGYLRHVVAKNRPTFGAPSP